MDWTADFDLDLSYGKVGEETLAQILRDGKIEVKTERGKWQDTGNIAIEYASRKKPSGILTTKADWWCTILMQEEKVVHIILTPIDRMKQLFKTHFMLGNKVRGGDSNTSELVLIPIRELIN